MSTVIVDPRYRLRSNTCLEALRFYLQLFIVLFIPWLVLAALISEFLYGERVWVLPFRLYEDAFGPLEDLWALKTPFVDRRRFDQPGNLWRPFVFPVDTSIGHLQLRCLQLFNFVARLAWEGHVVVRILVWLAGALFQLQVAAFVSRQSIEYFWFAYDGFRMRWPVAYGRAVGIYLRVLPEQCLFLEQLAFAQEAFGRKLSTAVEAEVKQQTAAKRREQEEEMSQQELSATVYGNRAPAPEIMLRA